MAAGDRPHRELAVGGAVGDEGGEHQARVAGHRVGLRAGVQSVHLLPGPTSHGSPRDFKGKVNLHVLHFLHPILTVSALRGHKSYGTCTEPAPALAPGEVLCAAPYVCPHLCHFNIVPGRGTNENRHALTKSRHALTKSRHTLPKTRHVSGKTWRVIEKCRVQEVQEVQVLFLLRYYT